MLIYLTDKQIDKILPFLNIERESIHDMYAIVNSIFHVLITGCQWINVGDCYPPFNTLFYYFRKWYCKCCLRQIMLDLNYQYRYNNGLKFLPQYLCMDTQTVPSTNLSNPITVGYDGNKNKK